jgi:hypothetical protein
LSLAREPFLHSTFVSGFVFLINRIAELTSGAWVTGNYSLESGHLPEMRVERTEAQ